MTTSAFITGVSDVALTAAERAFVREARPWGLILFKRNIETPAQVAALVASFREIVDTEAPVLVDQEGGRVQRLGPPHWPSYPAAAVYGALYERDQTTGIAAARLGARLIAHDLQRLGIDIDCLPLADLPVAGADPVIGDRAYGETPAKVATLAKAAAEGLHGGRCAAGAQASARPWPGQRPTVTSSFRWLKPLAPSSKPPTLRPSGHSWDCPWA